MAEWSNATVLKTVRRAIVSRVRIPPSPPEISNMADVILVDQNDLEVGTCEKLAAHQQGLLHRAFSIFIFNKSGQLLLQQRALGKYHSGGLWSNTVCSHPLPGEDILDAGKRRLQEEMGFVTKLNDSISFIYKAPFANGLTEHEYDHVLLGRFNDEPKINEEEVASWKWMSIENVKIDIALNPEIYTEWFKIIFEKFYEYINIDSHESESK